MEEIIRTLSPALRDVEAVARRMAELHQRICMIPNSTPVERERLRTFHALAEQLAPELDALAAAAARAQSAVEAARAQAA